MGTSRITAKKFATLCISSLLTLAVCAPTIATAKDKTVEEQYTVWKHGNFHRFVVDKAIDFKTYNKIILFPLNYSELTISPKAKTRMQRNWEDFAEKDMPSLTEKFAELANREFSKSKQFTPTSTGGKGVLVVEFKALEMLPRAYRDSSLGSVGSETIETVGTLHYQVALIDSATRKMVAMIEDDLPINLSKKRENNRYAHNRAWHRSFEYIIETFHENLVELAKVSPLKK
ncbi:DUF3313 family protein [Teredinibacter waterburyi]|uniref:DUF3313 family protein n=1 Tax=Teredinibacter waterburyi TaxID=1500538 RepID=UPI00165FC39E|nr:DUF3313 family protein [Teredinibacter waterburyi]